MGDDKIEVEVEPETKNCEVCLILGRLDAGQTIENLHNIIIEHLENKHPSYYRGLLSEAYRQEREEKEG